MTRRCGTALVVSLLFASGALAGDPPVSAADEDVLKLLDREPPVLVRSQPEGDPDDPNSPTAMFESENMTMLAQLTLSDFPGGSSSGNDCWGYVSPTGREYAIMGLERGYGFVEVTNPTAPIIIDYVAGPSSLWHDVKVVGQYAYGVSEGGSGVQVMDLSDIDNGNVTLVRNVTEQGHSSTHNIVANPDSGYIYAVGANIQNGGLVAFSTADPARPTIVGAWNAMYIHDAQVVSYTEGPYAGREIAFCLSGFNGGWSQTGLRIVDVTNKNNMFTMATTSWSGARYAHQGWLSEDRRYFYINDELDEGDSVGVTTTRVFDVSDLTDPAFMGTFTTGLPAIDHNLYVHDGKIFQSNYRSGLRVFDASDPINPTEVAWFDTYPSDDGAAFNGTWSNYPYLPSGTILVSDMERGLFLLRLSGVTINFIDAPVELDPNTPADVTVEIVETFDTYDAGTVTLHYSLNGGSNVDVSMVNQGGDVYTAALPGASCFDEYEYSVSVMTSGGTEASTEIISALVAGERVVAVDYDGESTSGWTVGDTGDSASTGVWNRMDPQPTAAQPGDDVSTDGTQCWVTDGRAGGGVGDYDVDGGKTTLKSPVYDLSSMGDPWLGVWVWYSNTAGADPNNDTFRIDFSANGGSSWTNAKTIGPAGEYTSGGWFYHEFRIADTVDPNSSFRARFVAEDAASGSIVEAAVDELSIFEYDCEDCIADFNGDGNVNTQDVLAFLNAWNAGDSSADVNGDGNVNTQDVITFLNLWNAGC